MYLEADSIVHASHEVLVMLHHRANHALMRRSVELGAHEITSRELWPFTISGSLQSLKGNRRLKQNSEATEL